MAIRFPGLALASAAEKNKERSRSRSGSPLAGEADKLHVVKGGRTKARQRTPSPIRAARVVKEVGIGRRAKAPETSSAPAAASGGGAAPAKPKPKAKAKVCFSAMSDSE